MNIAHGVEHERNSHFLPASLQASSSSSDLDGPAIRHQTLSLKLRLMNAPSQAAQVHSATYRRPQVLA